MWVAVTKSLKCTSLEEVYLLLKSSDRISRDLTAVKELTSDTKVIPPCLVLKKWRDINPCTEFRCFVVNRELVGKYVFYIYELNLKIYELINA